MSKRLSNREQERLLKRLGINLEEMPGVKEVRIIGEDVTRVIRDPSVFKVNSPGQTMYQIMGTEEILQEEAGEEEAEEEYTPADGDVALVAQRTGKSLEQARTALVSTKGDLAQAILLLRD